MNIKLSILYEVFWGFFSTGDNCELSVLLNDAEKSFQGVKLSSMFEQEFFLLFQNRFY